MKYQGAPSQTAEVKTTFSLFTSNIYISQCSFVQILIMGQKVQKQFTFESLQQSERELIRLQCENPVEVFCLFFDHGVEMERPFLG